MYINFIRKHLGERMGRELGEAGRDHDLSPTPREGKRDRSLDGGILQSHLSRKIKARPQGSPPVKSPIRGNPCPPGRSLP